MMYFVAVPLALAIIALAIFRLDLLLMLIVFLTPLSINIENVGMGMGLTVPTEPLLFGAMLVFLLKVWYDQKYDIRILQNPVTIAILLYLFWILIASMTSRLPGVSFKFLLAKLWFIIPMYFGGVLLFKKESNFGRFVWLYILPMAGVIIYTLSRQYVRGFDDEAAHWVMEPFFKDHTSYGAMIAFFIPMMMGYVFSYRKWDINAKILGGVLLIIFIAGVVFSLTRAAWVSLAGALVLYVLIKAKIRWWVLAMSALTIGAVIFMFRVEIMHKLEKNRQDAKGDIAEHVQSISNVATDASNLERLNRWHSAFRMFRESPLVGTGPGTYSFLYAPYQQSADLTVISTNFGDRGNAHSEYFGVLAEQGVPGLVFWLAIVFFIFYRGLRRYYKLRDKDQRTLMLGAILGLATYLSHGLLNNFLDTDKASVPFWGFVAMIVALDVYAGREENSGEAMRD